MWQMKTEIIPVVIGVLGVIKKSSEKFISEIPGNINLHQNTTLLETAYFADGHIYKVTNRYKTTL